MRFVRILLLAVCCVALCGNALAQTVTGTLDGHITDQGGAVVPQAHVAAKSLATGVERSTTTNELGYYQMPFLPLGQYQIIVSATGFATVVAEQVEITLNKTTAANLALRSLGGEGVGHGHRCGSID